MNNIRERVGPTNENQAKNRKSFPAAASRPEHVTRYSLGVVARELERLDKQLRTMKGSLMVVIAKRVDLKARIEHEERKLNEIQDPTYSDDQRNRIEDRIKRLRDELDERNKEIDILKGEASN